MEARDSLQKENIVKQLKEVLDGTSTLDADLYKELDFFMHLSGTEIDVDLIAQCICDNSYCEDFCFMRCPADFESLIGRFFLLVNNLRNYYSNC